MKKIIVATAALAMMCGSAFAQSSGTTPAPQSNTMSKPGTSGSMNKGSMDNNSMNKGAMGNDGTTGMGSGSGTTGGASTPTSPSGGSSNAGGQGSAGVAGGK